MEQQQPQEVQADQVAVLVLITSQIVVGKVTPTAGGIIVKQPLEIVILPNPQGRPEPRLTEYGKSGGLLPGLAEVTFEAFHVLHLRECPHPLEVSYRQATSGIQMATPEQKSVILGA